MAVVVGAVCFFFLSYATAPNVEFIQNVRLDESDLRRTAVEIVRIVRQHKNPTDFFFRGICFVYLLLSSTFSAMRFPSLIMQSES